MADRVLPMAAIKAECRRRGFKIGYGHAPRPWVLERRRSREVLAFPDREAMTDFLLRQPLQPMERL